MKNISIDNNENNLNLQFTTNDEFLSKKLDN